MRVIAQLLHLAGPLKFGFHLKIENPPWQYLVIEDIQQRGPNRFPVISVAHYGKQNGDLMRDPEMLFEAHGFGQEIILKPYYFRNDYAGVEQYSKWREGEQVITNPQLLREHEEFAQLWDRNLEQQGFIAAYERSRRSTGTRDE